MATIENATRDTQLFFHVTAASLACVHECPHPDRMGRPTAKREPSPLAAGTIAGRQIDELIADLDKKLGSQRLPPTDQHPATLGRLIAERGEKWDPKAKTYTTSPGFDAFIKGVSEESVERPEFAAFISRVQSYQEEN